MLLTDFGDGFVGVMKGVMLNIAPDANSSIYPTLSSRRTSAGGFPLLNSYHYFRRDDFLVVVIRGWQFARNALWQAILLSRPIMVS